MPPNSLLAVLGFLLAGYAASYAIACWLTPFGPCRLHQGPNCGRCDGTSRRVRFGRRLHTWLHREYHTANPKRAKTVHKGHRP